MVAARARRERGRAAQRAVEALPRGEGVTALLRRVTVLDDVRRHVPRQARRVAGAQASGRSPNPGGLGVPAGSVLLGDQRAGDRRARAHVELAEDVLQVALDGLHAEHQLSGDLTVGHALAHEPRDLLLAWAELPGRGCAATVRGEA